MTLREARIILEELRQAYIDSPAKIGFTNNYVENVIKKRIEAIETVLKKTMPVKYGRWIDCTFYDPYEKSYEQSYEFKCSICGHKIYHKPNDDNWFCGHCGAIMRGDTIKKEEEKNDSDN